MGEYVDIWLPHDDDSDHVGPNSDSFGKCDDSALHCWRDSHTHRSNRRHIQQHKMRIRPHGVQLSVQGSSTVSLLVGDYESCKSGSMLHRVDGMLFGDSESFPEDFEKFQEASQSVDFESSEVRESIDTWLRDSGTHPYCPC